MSYIFYIYIIFLYISSNNYVFIFMYKILWGISVTILIDFVSLWRTSLWGLASVCLLVVVVVDLSLWLKCLEAVLCLVLTSYVPPHSVVAREGTVTKGTGYTYPLMALTNVSTQVGFIPVKSLTERTFEFLTCGSMETVTCTLASCPICRTSVPF